MGFEEGALPRRWWRRTQKVRGLSTLMSPEPLSRAAHPPKFPARPEDI